MFNDENLHQYEAEIERLLQAEKNVSRNITADEREAAYEAFRARGGKVTKCPTGVADGIITAADVMSFKATRIATEVA